MIRHFGAGGLVAQPQGLLLGLGGNSVKSVQHLVITGTTATISPVDISKSIVICDEILAGRTDYICVGVVLTNSTTVTISQGTTYGTHHITVIEFNNVKSLQRGSFYLQTLSTVQNIAISPVNFNKAILFYSYISGLQSADISQVPIQAYLYDSSNIKVQQNSDARLNCYWQVIEFE